MKQEDLKKIFIEFADFLEQHGADNITKGVEPYADEFARRQINLSLGDVRLRSILEDRLISHNESCDNAWENLTSESKYKKEDGIEPFYRLQRMYKIKAEEIQTILDLYEA